jgi:hypothetical protein
MVQTLLSFKKDRIIDLARIRVDLAVAADPIFVISSEIMRFASCGGGD